MSRTTKGSPLTYVFAAIFIALIVAMYLAGCAPARPPATQPKPKPTAPATPGPVATPPPVVEDPNACPPDAPPVEEIKLDCHISPNGNKYVCDTTVKVKSRDYCPKHNTDPRSQYVCPYAPEGTALRHNCEEKLGRLYAEGGAWQEAGDISHFYSARGEKYRICVVVNPEMCVSVEAP